MTEFGDVTSVIVSYERARPSEGGTIQKSTKMVVRRRIIDPQAVSWPCDYLSL